MFPCLGLQSAETRVDEASNVSLIFDQSFDEASSAVSGRTGSYSTVKNEISL